MNTTLNGQISSRAFDTFIMVMLAVGGILTIATAFIW